MDEPVYYKGHLVVVDEMPEDDGAFARDVTAVLNYMERTPQGFWLPAAGWDRVAWAVAVAKLEQQLER